MKRSYNPFVDNGLFVAEYYLNIPYDKIDINTLKDNIPLFSKKLAQLIENNEIYKKLVYSTHMNSSFTQMVRNKTREYLISVQLTEILDNIGEDKYCIYCGEKHVNVNYIVDRKFIHGIVSKTYFNSANNLKTVDICPVCVFFSMLSILNTRKIGLPTLYISDSDKLMRAITKNIQESIANDNNEYLNINGSERYKDFIDICLLDVPIEEIGYITQKGFQNAGQIVNDREETIERNKIKLIRDLDKEDLLEEFINFGLVWRLIHDNLLVSKLLTDEVNYLSERLFKVLEEFELKEKEKQIIEYATKVLLKIETVEKLLKEIKLCDSRVKFTDFIMRHSETEPLVKDVEDFDTLTGYDWKRFKNYIQMNLLLNNK